MRVLVYGNANVDISVKPVSGLNPEADTTFVDEVGMCTGGNAMTAATVLKKLGVDCSLATYLGDGKDFFSDYLLKKIKDLGIDTSLVHCVEGETSGVALCFVSESGSRFFLYKKGVQKKMKLDRAVLESIPAFDVVSVHGTYLMPGFDGEGTKELLGTAKAYGKITLMDVTPDMEKKGIGLIEGALPYCDYFAPSILEARELTGKTDVPRMAEALLEAGVQNVIIKMGGEGVFYKNQREEGIVPAYPIAVKDTTGAGDCFCGGLIASFQYDMDFRERLRFASAVAGISCMHIGAAAGVESAKQVLAFMEKMDGR